MEICRTEIVQLYSATDATRSCQRHLLYRSGQAGAVYLNYKFNQPEDKDDTKIIRLSDVTHLAEAYYNVDPANGALGNQVAIQRPHLLDMHPPVLECWRIFLLKEGRN
jgi:hypothetical protein